MVIDPVARSTDGESVRIAKDVLCAGAGAKICLPEGPEEFGRMLARRGHRRPVVIGDDRTLLRVVGLLHKERELAAVPLSMVPVGAPAAVALSRALGVPTDTVAAARAVLDGGERPMDLLTDDSDGIVLGGLRIPCGSAATRLGHGAYVPAPAPPPAPVDPAEALGGRGGLADGLDGARPWWKPAAKTARTALAMLAAPAAGLGARRGRVPGQRLRIEADGVLLADLDRPVRGVSVVPGGRTGAEGPRTGAADGRELAEVVVHWPGGGRPVRARARAVTVSGADFHYRADALVGGPVRTRTWTVQPAAWRLQLPRG
ncbi:diacylglycerol kinase family protein [Streptomyces sp. P9-2B-2]|uniref:diacylglycerol kinase family protein n=1 Tax=Streptomyces TaxID=1883 RepID=UPI00225195FC|nr:MULTISPECIES: diacylglycerol kinase family protein [Streptomyces]MCX4639191.1 diacylglycerol kinase family protein [Streptomyces platensis]WJY39194.1 diacylglycerol kinase family protein [Streptomyces sp. P9-2B-2]